VGVAPGSYARRWAVHRRAVHRSARTYITRTGGRP
jgi:hypothetical protein